MPKDISALVSKEEAEALGVELIQTLEEYGKTSGEKWPAAMISNVHGKFEDLGRAFASWGPRPNRPEDTLNRLQQIENYRSWCYASMMID